MSKKRIVQIIAIGFLVIAVILLIPNTDWTKSTSIWGFISLSFGTLGSVISIFIPTTYTFDFLESDWQKNDESNEFSLLISAKKHGLGNSPQVQIYIRKNEVFQKYDVNSYQDKKGNITIKTTRSFIGKVIIT
jgi:hypothetical protein